MVSHNMLGVGVVGFGFRCFARFQEGVSLPHRFLAGVSIQKGNQDGFPFPRECRIKWIRVLLAPDT
jgi:hypothetical protein